MADNLTELGASLTRQSFTAYYAEHAGALQAYLLRLIRVPELAEELTQEAFYRAWRARDSFAGKSTFKTWIFAIAINLVHEQFRKKRETLLGDDANLQWRADPAPGPAEQADHNEHLARLRVELDRLPEELREALLLVRFGDMRYAEAAEALGITTDALRMRVHRAMNRLCERLT